MGLIKGGRKYRNRKNLGGHGPFPWHLFQKTPSKTKYTIKKKAGNCMGTPRPASYLKELRKNKHGAEGFMFVFGETNKKRAVKFDSRREAVRNVNIRHLYPHGHKGCSYQVVKI